MCGARSAGHTAARSFFGRHFLRGGVWGAGGGMVSGCLFVVCELHSGREHLCGQVFKGTRWMPWHQEPMKDVGGCVKPRGVANQTLIRGCPNGET